MADVVKTRPYASSVRAAGAERTRRRILAAARTLLRQKGYAATTVALVARRAGVSVDTLYASVGRKPELVIAVVDDILGEGAGPVPALQREYVVAVGAAEGLAAKLETYARAMGRVNPQVAPLLRALARAGEDDPACRSALERITQRRAANMRLLAADLRATGELREDLDDDEVADLIWATNSWEHYVLMTSRGYSPERYAAHLADLWTRTLGAPSRPCGDR